MASGTGLPCCSELQAQCRDRSEFKLDTDVATYIWDNLNREQVEEHEESDEYDDAIDAIPSALAGRGLRLGRPLAGDANGDATVFEVVESDGTTGHRVLIIRTLRRVAGLPGGLRRHIGRRDYEPLFDPVLLFRDSADGDLYLHVELERRYFPITERAFMSDRSIGEGVIDQLMRLSDWYLFDVDIKPDNFMVCSGRVLKIDFDMTGLIPARGAIDWPPGTELTDWADALAESVSVVSRTALLKALHLFALLANVRGLLPRDTRAKDMPFIYKRAQGTLRTLGKTVADSFLRALIDRGLKGEDVLN